MKLPKFLSTPIKTRKQRGSIQSRDEKIFTTKEFSLLMDKHLSLPVTLYHL